MCATNGGGVVNFAALKTLTGDRATFCGSLIALCLALFAAVPLYGQSGLTAASQPTASYTSDSQLQNPYLGGVPAGTASSTALALSLEDVVARGLRQNLAGLLSADAASGARGERWRALSALLPNLTTSSSFGVRQNDLKAIIGITVPGHRPSSVLLES
jgi:hypothetical protein